MDIKIFIWILTLITYVCSTSIAKDVVKTTTLEENLPAEIISTMDGNRMMVEPENEANNKEEDSAYLSRVGWPSFQTFERLRRIDVGEKVLYSSDDEGGKSLDSRKYLTSNAEHGADQEDSSSRKSNLNIWLTLLIAAVAAAIFS